MLFTSSNDVHGAERRHRYLIVGLFVLSLLGGLAIFWPGLSGPFLFDDMMNLAPLGQRGGITGFSALLEFVLSGEAGPLGRPIALLSFVINDQYWPANPWPFKYTNLLIHLLNGVLVFVLTLQLAGMIEKSRMRAELIALATMTVWLIHPMQLSTIMLVVQRMTELSAMFTVLGLILYLHGRKLLLQDYPRGYAYITIGIGLGTTLAALSKESGVLLPLYALVIEATLIRCAKLDKPRWWREWFTVCILLPLVTLAVYFLMKWPSILGGFEAREFTQLERLLTECRVLVDYLGNIVVPGTGGSGLFHDDYLVSTGLFKPLSTFFSACFLSGLLVVAFRKRDEYPILSFAVLWFFAGHLLESSFLPLELYFEHRNYLPMVGPLFALAYYANVVTGRFATLAAGTFALYVGLEIFLSLTSSSVWGNYAVAANVWANENPSSTRAQQMAADYWATNGNFDKALQHLRIARHLNPDDAGVQVQMIQMECLRGSLTKKQVKDTIHQVSVGNHDRAGLDTIEKLRTLAAWGSCSEFKDSDLDDLLDAYLKNPVYRNNTNSKSRIYYEKALLYASHKLLSPAVEAMDKAYEAKPNVDFALIPAMWLLSAGLYDDALQHIEIAKHTNSNSRFGTSLREKDIRLMERIILERRKESRQN